MTISADDRQRGVDLLVRELEEDCENDPEISDFHAAFEKWCLTKFALGNPADAIRTGKSRDVGIDFYSFSGNTFRIGQTKIPAQDYLEAHASKVKSFGVNAVMDVRNALDYLLNRETKLRVNDQVQALYAQIEAARANDDFRIEFYLIVFGQLNERALADIEDVKRQYATNKHVSIRVLTIDELVSDLIVGAHRSSERIEVRLSFAKAQVLSAKDYCYFLANAADVYKAFNTYGWRLFDLNLRYEVKNSNVNANIIDSLKYQKSRRLFHHLNNGLIIICSNYQKNEQQGYIKITAAQVVNGLQTVKSIYNAVVQKDVTVQELDENTLVQVKVVQNADPEFISSIVQATNNQNPMSARNLRANSQDQKKLRAAIAALKPRWFLQVKEGEWDSLTQEGGRFFKDVAGFPPIEFRVEASKKRGRVIDNQSLAKAWLGFIGYADFAADRTTHYFSDVQVYDKAFRTSPSEQHWCEFARSTDFSSLRDRHLKQQQGSASQYLLSYFLLELMQQFVPRPATYREEGLNEGVRDGKLRKSDGEIVSSERDQAEYLLANTTYQTWRMMANMKDSLVETLAFVLTRKYGGLSPETCMQLLSTPEGRLFMETADARPIAQAARSSDDLPHIQIFARTLGLLKFAAGQYWEEKQRTLLAASRLKIYLMSAEARRDFKQQVLEANDRRTLSRAWKSREGTFLDSLPRLADIAGVNE